jgi:Family of unknown function (DUF5681)
MTKKRFNPEPLKRAILEGAGFCKPPIHTRFKKGQSGNPLGRPRRQKPIEVPDTLELGSHAAIMRRVLLEPVKMRQGGQVREVSKAEAMQRSLEKQAGEGKLWATLQVQRQLLDDDARVREKIRDDTAFWETHLECYEAAKRAAERDGRPLSEFWILPEDIKMVPGRLTRVRGPTCAEEMPFFESLQKLQQALMAHYMFQLSCLGYRQAMDPGITKWIETFWALVNTRLTVRMEAESGAYRTNLEDLLLYGRPGKLKQEVIRAWAACGLHVNIVRPLPRIPPRIRSKLAALWR